MNPQDFLRGGELDAVSAARFAFVLTCIGITVVLWRSSPLEPRIKRAAAAAGIVHFFFSFTADVLLVQNHEYMYDLRGLYLGVPLELHIAWAALWGTGFCLTWERLNGWRRIAFYAVVVIGTLGWDWIIVSQTGIVLGYFDPLFPLDSLVKWDVTLLTILPLVTVRWFWLVKENRALWIRAIVYALFYAVGFYELIPGFVIRWACQIDHCAFSTWLHVTDELGGYAAIGWQGLDDRSLVFIILATLLGAWAAWELFHKGDGTPLPLDPTRKLVTSGPYAYVRNPMQLSGVGVAIVLAVAFGSWYLAFYALDLVILLLFMNAWEKEELARVFGEPYVQYASSVRNWLPRWKAYRADAMQDAKSPSPLESTDR